MYKVYIENLGGRELAYPEGTGVETVLRDVRNELPYPVYVSKLDNAYRALTHKLTHDSRIEFLDLRNQEAWQVYQNSLVMIFIKAVHDVLGKDVRISIRNALNMGIFVTLTHKVDDEVLAKVEARMREIVGADLPITKEHYTKDGAMDRAVGHAHSAAAWSPHQAYAEAAVVACDAGPDVLLPALPGLVEPLGIRKELACNAYTVYLARGDDLVREGWILHASGAEHRDVDELLDV